MKDTKVKSGKSIMVRDSDGRFVKGNQEERMSYKELCLYIKKKADSSPRILNLLLDHRFGKPVEQVQHRVVPTFVIVDNKEPQDDAEEAEVIDGEQFKLPEGD
jgi:hypothetical protein